MHGDGTNVRTYSVSVRTLIGPPNSMRKGLSETTLFHSTFLKQPHHPSHICFASDVDVPVYCDFIKFIPSCGYSRWRKELLQGTCEGNAPEASASKLRSGISRTRLPGRFFKDRLV